MISVFLFRVVHVRPGPESRMRQENPARKGAYVNMAVPAVSEDEAQQVLLGALREDDYAMLSYDEVVELGREGAWLHADTPEEFLEMAREALEEEDVIYGPFNCW